MSKSITVRCYGKSPGFAQGGLHEMAETARQAGTKDDEVLLHLSPEEFQAIRSHWGEPDINPHTGLPEYAWLSDVFKTVSPTLLSKLIPGLSHSKKASGEEEATSGLLEKLLNKVAGTKLSGSSISDAASSAILGALLSKVTGGSAGEGAKLGAIGSVGLPMLGNAASGTGIAKALGVTPQDSILDELGMGDWLGGKQAATATPPAAGAAEPTVHEAQMSGLKKNWPMLLAQVAYIQKQKQAQQQKQQQLQGALSAELQQFNAPSTHNPITAFPQRTATPNLSQVASDYYTYGERPEKSYYSEDTLGDIAGHANGGEISGVFATGGDADPKLVKGPGTGRSDDIPARLSDGEYVMDAETVALLGDGSTEAGAKKLDELRKRLRMDKGKNLAKGKFSANAKDPEHYLGEAE